MDMNRYLHGGVNITVFQLLDLESQTVKDFMRDWRRLDRYTYPNHNPNKLSVSTATSQRSDTVTW